jgi:hypothetical protein
MKKETLNEELGRIKGMMGLQNLTERKHSYSEKSINEFLDPNDEEDYEPPMCGCCGGSGEGSHDGSTCSCCGGSGEERIDSDDFDYFDDSDYEDSRTAAKHWGGMDESELSEQPVGPNKYTYKSPGPTQTTTKMVATPITLGAGLFLNGVDKIDTSSVEYQNGVKRIEQVSEKNGGSLDVTVTGGASAVGSPSYDNEGLAKRRAQNFIDSVKDKFPNVKFNITTKVGKATVKNSPEANAEQFVKLNFSEPTLKSSTSPAIETTAAVMKNIVPLVKKVPKPKVEETKVSVCFDIPTSRLKYIKWIVTTLGGVAK